MSSEVLKDSQTSERPGLWDRLWRRMVHARLQRLTEGELELSDGLTMRVFGQPDAKEHLQATIDVLDWRFYRELAMGGGLGAAEAYLLGYWRCDDLTALVRLLVRNRDVLEGMDNGMARFSGFAQRLLHWMRRNTRSGSRRNIAAHYDLGNEFFSLWLDQSMMYSCAVFEQADATLDEAAAAKLERICRKLELEPGDHVLEIGSGWGGFALYAARHYGCRVTTTTVSREQYEYTRQQVAAAGLQDRIEVLCDDYRDLEGCYDKLVSIEMIEAVGHQFLDDYFRQCSRLLRPSGMMLLQGITIADQRYEQARRSVDFIKHYIFPGGFLPSVTAMLSSVTAAGDMRLYHLEDIGPHYATTLRHWRERFFHRLDDVRELGFSDRFVRMWEYYLCYCEGAFMERAIGNVQMLLIKPRNQRVPVVPAARLID